MCEVDANIQHVKLFLVFIQIICQGKDYVWNLSASGAIRHTFYGMLSVTDIEHTRLKNNWNTREEAKAKEERRELLKAITFPSSMTNWFDLTEHLDIYKEALTKKEVHRDQLVYSTFASPKWQVQESCDETEAGEQSSLQHTQTRHWRFLLATHFGSKQLVTMINKGRGQRQSHRLCDKSLRSIMSVEQ